MFEYKKFLEYPVKITSTDPRLANIIITQYGGPNGELGASVRYLSQRYTMPDDISKGLLTDIGTPFFLGTQIPDLSKKKQPIIFH